MESESYEKIRHLFPHILNLLTATLKVMASPSKLFFPTFFSCVAKHDIIALQRYEKNYYCFLGVLNLTVAIISFPSKLKFYQQTIFNEGKKAQRN